MIDGPQRICDELPIELSTLKRRMISQATLLRLTTGMVVSMVRLLKISALPILRDAAVKWAR